MRKRSLRERARWDHYRMRGTIMLAAKSLYMVLKWAQQNGYHELAANAARAHNEVYKTRELIPTHPSEEYLERNS